MSIEETYKGMWSSDPSLLKSLLDAGETIIRKHGIGLMPIFVTHLFGEPRYETYDSDWDSQYIDAKDFADILFLIPPRPLILEPKPLEWHHRDMNEEAFASYGDWSFYAWHDGDWEILYDVDRIGGGETKDGNFDTAKAAIEKWRVNHLKSMLP